jgi:hypothetical protein
MSKNRTMFKLSYYVFDFENKYCCLFLINKGTLLYDQPSYFLGSGHGGVALIGTDRKTVAFFLSLSYFISGRVMTIVPEGKACITALLCHLPRIRPQ